MSKLTTDQQATVIRALVEGCSIRSTERMTGIHRDTILRLLMQVGEGCHHLMDRTMRHLTCQRIQVDEIWAFVGKKQSRLTDTDDPERTGDVWTFVALDADTKLIPAYRLGQRTTREARAFMSDLSGRLDSRVQLSSDSLAAYVDAVERAFGAGIDYGQIVKSYEATPTGSGRYSPPKVVAADRYIKMGAPEYQHINTSFVERQNLTIRMSCRRFTRLTNAFSKKYEYLKAAAALHFAHYNFCRTHRTLRVTPAMEAGILGTTWSIPDLIRWADRARLATAD